MSSCDESAETQLDTKRAAIALDIGNISSHGVASIDALAPLAVGLAAAPAFVHRQLKSAEPFLDLRILANRTFAAATGTSMLLYLVMMGASILAPLFVQQVAGQSAAVAGLAMLPGSLCMALMSSLAGSVYDRMGTKVLLVAGGAANTTAGSAASANDSGPAAAGDVLHSSTGTFDWTATMADQWEAGDQKFFRYVITVTNKGDSAVSSRNVRLPLSGAVTISDSWNATVSIDGAELTLDSVSYNGALAPQATAQDIGFILSGNALPNSDPITS